MSPLLAPLQSCPTLRLDDLAVTPTMAVARITSTALSAPCPRCRTSSNRVHSHYHRTIADLPCHDRPIALRLVVRRFRCINPCCSQVIFCKRLPELLDAHARSTTRLTNAHRAIGFALGVEASSRLAGRLNMPTSPDTLLRRVKDAAEEPVPMPRYVGVDDWAIRKGQRYGTILIDLERGRVIDILEGRDGEALESWLKEHPGVEVITRDRWAAYAQAAAEAAPQAQQVADRWHLLKNRREALERLLGRLEADVADALPAYPTESRSATATSQAVPTTPAPEFQPAVSQPTPLHSSQPVPSTQPSVRQARRQQRVARHAEVRLLREQGLSLRQTRLSLKTVRRYCWQDHCPDWKPGRHRRTQADAFTNYIEEWIAAGGRNAAELFRQLQVKGYAAGYDAVRRFVNRRLGSRHRPGPRTAPCVPPPPPLPSTRQLSFELLKRAEKRQDEEQARVDRLRAWPALCEPLELAESFAALVRKQATCSFSDWLARAERSGCRELMGFAMGLRQDEAAVRAALTTRWSNGPVEGQVNRLKVIKRQMYGRAGLRLLRARVVNAA